MKDAVTLWMKTVQLVAPEMDQRREWQLQLLPEE
jgi:hypothetical protein